MSNLQSTPTGPEKTEGSMSFIQGLGEARMFKTKQQIAHEGADNITNHLFVSLMSLYMMSNSYDYSPVAKEYSRRTSNKGNFNMASPSGTDMYQTIHTLLKPNGLLGDEKDKLLLSKIKVDHLRIKRFLKQIEQGKVPAGQAQQFFYKLEKDLAIQDPKLRATRRLVQNWNDLSTQQQQLAATQLNRYYRGAGMRSDLRPLFTKYAADSKLVAGPRRMGKIAKTVARKATAFGIGYAAAKATGV